MGLQPLCRGITYTDLRFLDRPRVIATAVLQSVQGVALVDPGPTSCLATLEATLAAHGITVGDIATILLTHIHLDHAGATGTLVRANPSIQVYVHERGARHMIDPAKLLESARRLFGDEMDRLYGEFVPVPVANVRILTGGERIEVGDRAFEVAYTPGHASHHVSYYDADSRIAFVGDVAGIRTGPDLFVMPPTLPPDIDLEAWRDSVTLVERWQPDTLFVTHFGPHSGVSAHLQALLEGLETMSQMVLRTLEGEGTDEERMARFTAEMRIHLRQRLSEAEATLYDQASRLPYCWMGLARYWRKKSAQASAS